MAEVWGVSPSSSYDLHVWDDEAVVFVQATADTHHLSNSATAVLGALRAEPGASRPALDWYHLLLGDRGAPSEEEAEEFRLELTAFESLLLGLERIGLVVRRPA
jgi:hypothetical protein